MSSLLPIDPTQRFADVDHASGPVDADLRARYCREFIKVIGARMDVRMKVSYGDLPDDRADYSDMDHFDELMDNDRTDVCAAAAELVSYLDAQEACERCHAEPITDTDSGLGDNCIANNEGRVIL